MAKPDLEKRAAFACAYAELGNATQAALSAGVPLSSAHSMGYRWLRADRGVAMLDRLGWVPPRRAEAAEPTPLELHEMTISQLEEMTSGQRGMRLDQASLAMIAQDAP